MHTAPADKKFLARCAEKKRIKRTRGLEGDKLVKRKISIIKRMPRDFRDIEPGSQLWQDVQWAWPKKVDEMQTWEHGSILLTTELTKGERFYLRDRICVKTKELYPAIKDWTWETFNEVEQRAIQDKVSFIYVPQLASGLIVQLNKLVSLRNLNYRWKERMTSSTGFDIGVM